ncbi:MAG: hypothetical protein JWN70_6602, partial [Planctomycetaceae bacterium]|nr:hypothetical protein [Planctomycetaceae bacterium]
MPDPTEPRLRGARARWWLGGLCFALAIAGLVRLAYPAWRAQQIIAELNARGINPACELAFDECLPTWMDFGWRQGLLRSVKFDNDFVMIDDDDMPLIGELFTLTYSDFDEPRNCMLFLSRSEVTDAGLAHLSGQAPLTVVRIESDTITDAGIKHLAKLRRLTNLELAGPHITDQCLMHLQRMTELEELRLRSPLTSNAGLKYLPHLTSLTHLSLEGRAITDTDLEHLRGFHKLEMLFL